MRHPRTRLAATLAAALAAVAGAAASPTAASRCSKPDHPYGQPELYFIGTASADTLPAGWTGAVGIERVRADTVQTRLTGLLVDVERAGGPALDRIGSVPRRVLVVPWSYLPDCTPKPWTGGRWVTPGVRGMIWGRLRLPQHWVDGIPTLDLHEPYGQPYGRPDRARFRDDRLTADELFELTGALPPPGTEPALALEPLRAWARAHPQLAGRHPAMAIIGGTLHGIEEAAVREVRPAFAGTWRFTLELGDGAPRVFYARTESRATGAHRTDNERADLVAVAPRPVLRYAIWTVTAPSVEALENSRSAPGGYFVAELAPVAESAGERVWRAGAEWSLVDRALPEDTAVRRVRREVMDGLRAYINANLPPGGQGFFRVSDDGRATFAQVLVLHNGATAWLRGERISRATADGAARQAAAGEPDR